MNTYTTARGKTIRLLSIQTFLDKFSASHPEPPAPTYDVQTATGVVEQHPLSPPKLETDEQRAKWNKYLLGESGVTYDASETSVLSDDEKRAWLDYQATLKAHGEKTSHDFMNLILRRGVDFDMPEGDGWANEQRELFGIDVPTEPDARRQHYFETEIIGNALDDLAGIVQGVMAVSGIPKEMLSELDSLFRSALGRRPGNGNASDQPATEARQVVAQPEIDGGADRVSNGKVSKRVGRGKPRG